jgi:hypothetical protein
LLIGLGGFIDCGKGTVAKQLEEKHGFISLSFADPVKDACAVIFGWPRVLLEGDTKESRQFRETPDEFWSHEMGEEFTPRKAMQLMGTEAGRNVFHPELWVIALKKKIKPGSHYVVPDVRFVNEINMIRQLGGFYVEVYRGPEPVWLQYAKDLVNRPSYYTQKEILIENFQRTNAVHYSEWARLECESGPDFLLDNNGTLDSLEANVQYMLKLFTGPGREGSFDTLNELYA